MSTRESRYWDARDDAIAEDQAERDALADDYLDPAETVVYDALRALGCTTGAVDPVDPEDCASVAAEAVRALRQAGYHL